MNATQTGLLAGLILGVAGAFGGFGAFLIVLVLGAIGLVVGRVLDGQLDINTVLGKARSLGAATKTPTQLTAQQRNDVAAAVQDARVDVFTGSSDRAEITVYGPPGPLTCCDTTR